MTHRNGQDAEGRDRWPPPFPPKGFAPPLGTPFTHPLPEPDPPPPLPPGTLLGIESGSYKDWKPGVDLGPPKVELREETKPKGKKK